MFSKGNQYGRGRPKISLNKPELLLPIIFQKAHINWANDFTLLYKQWKAGFINPLDARKFDLYLQLMPYLCTKVNIKDLDASKFVTERDQKAMTDQTAALLEALENETKSSRNGKEAGLANRPSQIPPKA
jgi:hypothetical protein